MLKLKHCSDNHGFFKLDNTPFDFVVNSGDFCPNSNTLRRGKWKEESIYQLNWIKNNIDHLKAFLQGKDLLFIPGNHDFLDPNDMAELLNNNGITAINLENKITKYKDLTFYGFSYIPRISGAWNYEKTSAEMHSEVNKLSEILNENIIDILVCHSPPYGILDKMWNGQSVGNLALINAINYKINNLPKYILFGHIHEANGILVKDNVVYSNAATTNHIITYSNIGKHENFIRV